MKGVEDFLYVLLAAIVFIVAIGIIGFLGPPVPGPTNQIANFSLGSIGFVSDTPTRTDNMGSFVVGDTQRETLKTVPKLQASASIAGGEATKYQLTVPSWLRETMRRVRVKFSVVETNFYGKLIIKWNGREVFNQKASIQDHTILIDPELVKESNNIEISAEGPGWLFWATTVYDIRNFNVEAEYGPAKLIPIQLSQRELETWSNGEITFFGAQPGSSILIIKVNGIEIYRKQPFGNDLAEFDLARVPLRPGTNIISFDTIGSSYNLQNVRLKVFLLSNEVVRTNEFELTDSQWLQLDRKSVTGKVTYRVNEIFRDGRLSVKIGGKELGPQTPSNGWNTLEFDSFHVIQGMNEIVVSGTGHWDISEMKIILEPAQAK